MNVAKAAVNAGTSRLGVPKIFNTSSMYFGLTIFGASIMMPNMLFSLSLFIKIKF